MPEQTVILPTGKRYAIDQQLCNEYVEAGLLRIDNQGTARLRKWIRAFLQPDGSLKFERVAARTTLDPGTSLPSQLKSLPLRCDTITCWNCFEDVWMGESRSLEGRSVCKTCFANLCYPSDYLTQKLLATPTWVDKKAMRAIYAECKRISIKTGVRHVVDHIIPLRHPLVCGLNIPLNLQIIPAVENSRKSNNFEGHKIQRNTNAQFN